MLLGTDIKKTTALIKLKVHYTLAILDFAPAPKPCCVRGNAEVILEKSHWVQESFNLPINLQRPRFSPDKTLWAPKSQACISVQLIPILGFAFLHLVSITLGSLNSVWRKAGGFGDTEFPLCGQSIVNPAVTRAWHGVLSLPRHDSADPPAHRLRSDSGTARQSRAMAHGRGGRSNSFYLQAPVDKIFYRVFTVSIAQERLL